MIKFTPEHTLVARNDLFYPSFYVKSTRLHKQTKQYVPSMTGGI